MFSQYEKIIPGTTPKQEIEIDVDTEMIEKLRITYCQDGHIVFQKEQGACSLSENLISVKLTQEETLKFKDKITIEVTLKVRTTGGDVIVSDPILISCGEAIDREVL